MRDTKESHSYHLQQKSFPLVHLFLIILVLSFLDHENEQ